MAISGLSPCSTPAAARAGEEAAGHAIPGLPSHDFLPGLRSIRYRGYVIFYLIEDAAPLTARVIVNRVWADLMGHMMGEAQAKCGVEKSDDLLLHFWSRQRTVLRRADRISVSGHKQLYAVLGELGALGRLGYQTPEHQFCSLIPIAADPMFLEMDLPVLEKKYRGTLFPDETYAVLWTGGYNTWTDVKALAAALTLAMAADHVRQGLRVNAVVPGTADTPWVRRLLAAAPDPQAELQALAARQPSGRLVGIVSRANLLHGLIARPGGREPVEDSGAVAARVLAFYDRHYAPGNAVLAIAGDFRAAEARALVQRLFGSLPARALPERSALAESHGWSLREREEGRPMVPLQAIARHGLSGLPRSSECTSAESGADQGTIYYPS